MANNRIYILALALTCSCGLSAQAVDDFDRFMNEELTDFDRFIDKANQEFIEFLRDPWKEFESEKPVVKRKKPEPPKPVVFDESKEPSKPTPVQLTIEEILGITTAEGGQRPTITVGGGEEVDFDCNSPVTTPATPAKPDCAKEKPKRPAAPGKPEGGVDVAVTPKPARPAAPGKPEGGVDVAVTPKPARPAAPGKPEGGVDVAVTPRPARPTEPVCPENVDEPTDMPNVPVTVPAEKPGKPSKDKVEVAYCGMKLYFDKALNGTCKMRNISENAVADNYESMSRADYQTLVAEIAKTRKSLGLNDWAETVLIKNISDVLCGGDASSSVVMQHFLLTERGYKARMAMSANKTGMMLFVAVDCMIYARPYITLDGSKYYNMSSTEACPFYMCEKSSSKSRNMVSMYLDTPLQLNDGMVSTTHTNKAGTVSVTVDVPKSLMSFYKDMPQCDYSVYSKAKVNPYVENKLLTSLSKAIAGKSETDAANMLINFVQTGFKYATDQEQFGYEKPFFVEELFYYPYCDCEDRSILYAYLVRRLLGLDVVYLDYPQHIATAVCFKGNVQGDFVMVDGRKYIVCDPTYIGASIGNTMPQFRNVAAKVLKY